MNKIIFIILAATVFAACHPTPEPTTSNVETVVSNKLTLTAEQKQVAGITTVTPQTGTMATTLQLNGTAEATPQNQVSVCAPLGGYLQSNSIMPGAYVNKGQQLALLEDPQFISLQQDYLTAKAMLEVKSSEYERQLLLNKTKTSSDKIFETARADYQSQKIAIRAMEEKLRLIGIDPTKLTEDKISRSIPLLAPISGYISSVHMNTGQYANPTDVIFSMTNPDKLYLSLKAFEKDIKYISVGQKLKATSNAYEDNEYTCTVQSINMQLDADRSVRVICTLDNSGGKILPGAYFTAHLDIKSQDGYIIKSESVINFENKSYVFVVNPSSEYVMTEVTILGEENAMTQIQFLNAIDTTQSQIVEHGAYALLMKLKNNEE